MAIAWGGRYEGAGTATAFRNDLLGNHYRRADVTHGGGDAMSSDLLIAVATFLLVAVTGVGILLALRGVRDQVWILTFSEYTRRYAEVMEALPFEARRPGGDYNLDG